MSVTLTGEKYTAVTVLFNLNIPITTSKFRDGVLRVTGSRRFVACRDEAVTEGWVLRLA